MSGRDRRVANCTGLRSSYAGSDAILMLTPTSIGPWGSFTAKQAIASVSVGPPHQRAATIVRARGAARQ